jgi:hypothetical protein
MREPAVRARGVQAAIRWADDFDGRSGEVKSLIAPSVLEHITSATPTAWIPLELDQHLCQAIVDVHGDEGAARCWREFIGPYAQGPALRGFVDTSKRLFGLTHAAVAKAIAKGWEHSYRDFCVVRAETGDPHHALIVFEKVHARVFAHPPYELCFKSLCEGACDIVGPADVQMKRYPKELRWEFHLRW